MGYDDDEEFGDRASKALRSEVTSEKGESSRINPRPILPKPTETISYTRQELQLADRDRKNTSSLDTPISRSPFSTSCFFSEFSPPEARVNSASETSLASYVVSVRGTAPAFDYDNSTPIYPAENRIKDPRPQNQSPSFTQSATSLQPAPLRNPGTRNPETSNAIDEQGLVVRILYKNIPRSVNGNTSMRTSYFTFTMGQYDLIRVRALFQPPPVSLKDMISARIMRSGANLWILYLAAKIFEQLKESPRNAVVRPFVHWINKCDQQLTNTLDPNCSVEELENRLNGLIELVSLKFLIINFQAGYSLLERSLPIFFALTSTDPSLWMEYQALPIISVARALGCPRTEIQRFVYRDVMTAFALGVPSLVQYDTSDFLAIPEIVELLEVAHGIPFELVMIIVKVNAWRTSNPGIPNANDWPDLELRVLAWIPRALQFAGEDSYEFIVRSALQESWRQAVLIYIYMGMRCVGSQDHRVQQAVRQIIQLIEIVSGSPVDIHLLFASLTAGIAARYEQQRATVRNTLSSICGTRMSLLPGAEFTAVLDHLWHGKAATGASITWEDYVCSRRAVLPLV